MNISILGCGWLGLSLGEFFVKKGYQVKGSTTSKEKLSALIEKGIQAFEINLSPQPDGDLSSFLHSDILIINIPPGTRTKPENFHTEQISNLLPFLQKSNIKKVIYISSTSVYPDLNREVKEEDVLTLEQAANKTLACVEILLQSEKSFQTTILRCAGLTGYDRLLIRHFAGKKDLSIGEEPINLIHREDVIGIISTVIEKNKWNEVYNICSPEHPFKKQYYPALAKRYGYEIPEFKKPVNTSFKIINTEKLVKDLNYTFIYPDLMNQL